jgi:biopolymer transport protein ExbB
MTSPIAFRFRTSRALPSLLLTLAATVATRSALAADTARTVAVENPYGLDALWASGDIVARGTLVILVVMSLGSWYLIVTRLLAQRKLVRDGRHAHALWERGALSEAVGTLDAGSPYRLIARRGLEALERHPAVAKQVDLHTFTADAIQRAIDKVQARLQGGLSFLATVGSTAPFIGLFGTVWGIYHALTAIGIAGQASIDKVAGPVGEALIMTAIGLAVAVPAVLGYNWLVRRNKSVLEEVRTFSADLHEVLLGGDAARLTSAASQPAGSEAEPRRQPALAAA